MTIRYLVVHCSATRCNVPFTLERLEQCHRQNGWDGIGYHFYITRDGLIRETRPLGVPGIHARGFNHCSIGVCYEGGLDEQGRPADTRTLFQRDALLDVLTVLKHRYPDAQITGHGQLPGVAKACPCFDARKEYGGM